jgi:glyoxylase-like metal-dependent hydrolase (beta-lactamase superfamily II)
VPDVIEVSRSIWRITTPLPFRPLEVHAYVVRGAGSWWLVDGGARTEEGWAALKAGVQAMGLAWSELEAHVVTHMHLDHLGLAGRIRETSGGAPLWMGALDAERVSGALRAPEDETTWRASLFQAHGAPDAVVAASSTPANLAAEVVADAAFTGESGELPWTHGWRYLWTPGHTAGHVALVREEDGTAIVGDAVLSRITPTLGVNRQRHDPVGDYLGTLDRLDAVQANCMLPGHGAPILHPGARLGELRQSTREETGRIAGLLRASPRTAWQVATLRYAGRDLPMGPLLQAFRETIAHLEHLVRQGGARRVKTGPGALAYRAHR